jgi:ankyrin repeat protein
MDTDLRYQRIVRGRTDLIVDILRETSTAPTCEIEGASLLQWAAYYGDTSAVRVLLQAGAHLSQLGPDLGLNASAFHGHWQLCEFLIDMGADPDGALPETGETPLHAALTNDDRLRYDRVVQVLLRAGANPNALTRAGVATGALMRDARTRGESPLHRAAAFGGADTVRLLLDAGGDREQADAHGDSPLAWASWYRRPVEVLRLLLYGAHAIHPDYRTLRDNLIGFPD